MVPFFNILALVQRNMTSPLDFITNNILKSCATQTFLKKFIACQFQLKWKTPNGWPMEFSYYDFCEAMWRIKRDGIENMVENVLKNTVRNAQVKVQLYKCYMSDTQNEINVKKLCPTVYVRTEDDAGTKQWKSLNENLNALEGNGVNNFDWISEPFKEYILDKVETIPEAELLGAGLTERLKKHTLYWVVVQDSNFPDHGENSGLEEIGRTQVYVGKANNGIKDRWLTSPSSHCHNMKKCLSVFRDVKTYNAELVSDVLLVDAVLLLEKLKGNTNSAIFLMKTFDGTKELQDAERRNIVGKKMSSDHDNIIPCKLGLRPRWKPIDIAYGMNVNR